MLSTPPPPPPPPNFSSVPSGVCKDQEGECVCVRSAVVWTCHSLSCGSRIKQVDVVRT